MAEFKEELVINALHKDKAEVGKKYWVSNNILSLKEWVTEGKIETTAILERFCDDYLYFHVFVDEDDSNWEYLYPYEEPPNKGMTYRQLAEWCAKGFGEYTHKDYENAYTNFSYDKEYEDLELIEGYYIRTWDSEEWIEPTVDIYERDCKGGYVCFKEYNDKCLAQKIQYIKELKEEIEEMKKYCGCDYCINVVSGDEFTVENTNKTVCEYCMENNKKFWKSVE